MKSLPKTVLLLTLLLLMPACRDNPDSPEDQIRRFIEAGVQAAEKHSVDELGALVHDDYIDQQGRNRKQIGLLLRGYFLRHKSIHLFTRIDSIEILADNQASVSLHVAMAGAMISDVDALSSLRARIYRFELQLIRQGGWMLRHASWAPAEIGAFE